MLEANGAAAAGDGVGGGAFLASLQHSALQPTEAESHAFCRPAEPAKSGGREEEEEEKGVTCEETRELVIKMRVSPRTDFFPVDLREQQVAGAEEGLPLLEGAAQDAMLLSFLYAQREVVDRAALFHRFAEEPKGSPQAF